MVLLDNGGRKRAELQIVPAPADLHALVEHVWVQTHRPRAHARDCGADDGRDWRVVPDASAHLIAAVTEAAVTRPAVVDAAAGGAAAGHTRAAARAMAREATAADTRDAARSAAERKLRVAVVGPRSEAAAIDVSRRIVTVGIRLRPGVLPAIVRASAADLTDAAVPIATVFPARLLRELELSADAPASRLAEEMLRLVRRAAEAARASASGAHRAMLLAVPQVSASASASDAPSIAEIEPASPVAAAIARASALRLASVQQAMALLGVPERTLRDRVLREIGLSPKRTLRILRLHRALAYARRRELSLSAIAQMGGYADQAHFTRECRALLGETPSQWTARGTCRFVQDDRDEPIVRSGACACSSR